MTITRLRVNVNKTEIRMNDFYTVTQYAKLLGKDPGNIRRQLINGALKGKKIGNQWVIPNDVEYPADKRIKSGDYHNWRQQIKLNSKHPEMIKRLREMCEKIGKIYKGDVTEILLYGSYARGMETDESDVDMALMLKTEQTQEQYELMTDVVVDYELDLGITLSIIPVKSNEFMEWKTTIPFYRNLEKEGIVLWKSA